MIHGTSIDFTETIQFSEKPARLVYKTKAVQRGLTVVGNAIDLVGLMLIIEKKPSGNVVQHFSP